jgi:hypothetical protein
LSARHDKSFFTIFMVKAGNSCFNINSWLHVKYTIKTRMMQPLFLTKSIASVKGG